MKKYITERKWEKIYRQNTDGLCEKKMEDGSKVFTADKFLKCLCVDIWSLSLMIFGGNCCFFSKPRVESPLSMSVKP